MCVLALSPHTATLSVLIDGADIVVERFPKETEARRYGLMLYTDFISMGCVDPSNADANR
jgi:hypothetical protein